MLRLAAPLGIETRDLLFYDQRGGGRSRAESRERESDITWQTHVHDLDRVIDELEVRPLTVVGYSWGGLLALLYAREAAASRVNVKPSRLVLIDPAPVASLLDVRPAPRFSLCGKSWMTRTFASAISRRIDTAALS
jgi:pimeloyl-ACP methyl ester carboxylesterase